MTGICARRTGITAALIAARALAAALAVALVPMLAAAQAAPAADCNAPARDAVSQISVDGNPFTPIPSADGCWIFVTLAKANMKSAGAVAVLSRKDGKIAVQRKIPVDGNPTGAVLTHDGLALIVTTGDGIAILDVARMESGHGSPVLGRLTIGQGAETIFTNVSADDSLLFVSEERAHSIAVIDLAKTRANGYRALEILGYVPAGNAPIALTFSRTGQYLFTTSQVAPPVLGWPSMCAPEGQDAANATPNHAYGAILIVDVERTRTDAAHSVLAAVAAGCNPVRLALAPKGDVLYATSRGDGQLLAFNAVTLLSDPPHALMGTVNVGIAPVGVVVVDSGARVIVTNSNRFGADASEPQVLGVVDAEKLAAGGNALLGTIPAGAFPREMRVTADGKTLLLSNFLSKTVEVVDIARMTPSAVGKRK